MFRRGSAPRSGAALLAVMTVVALGMIGTTPTAAATGWSILKSPNGLARNASLSGVSCSSASVCISVGKFTDTTGKGTAIAELWNSGAWSSHPPKRPAGAADTALLSAACSSASNCTAVGSYLKSSYVRASLAERWDGTAWTIEPTPKPSGATASSLTAVSCPSTTSCLAIGSANGSSIGDVVIAERWDGTSWTVQTIPKPSNTNDFALTGLACSGVAACTAVGASYVGTFAYPLAERWDGSNWTEQSVASTGSAVSSFFGVSCPSATFCMAVGDSPATQPGTIGATLAEQWSGGVWSLESTQNVSGAIDNALTSVSCVGSNSCMAVGNATPSSNVQPLSEAWNAGAWSITTAPLPAGANGGSLAAVACSATTACATAGFAENNVSGVRTAMFQSWDGTAWAGVALQSPLGVQGDSLSAVSCPTSNACTAVGGFRNTAGRFVSLAERWDGATWAVQSTPNPSGETVSRLSGVSCPSASTCIAVGTTFGGKHPAPLAEQWDGTKWVIQSLPSPNSNAPELSAISCASAASCIAVGAYSGSGGYHTPFAEQWNGTAWTLHTLSIPPGAVSAQLNGVSCTSANACVAVGSSYDSNSGTTATLAVKWDGTAWSVQATPGAAGYGVNVLNALFCSSATNCEAVGYSSANYPNQVTLAERWNGSSWSIQSTPTPSSFLARLSGISCPSATLCDAVGTYSTGYYFYTVVERWDGSSWSIQVTPNQVGAAESSLVGISCASSDTCIAVGSNSRIGFDGPQPGTTLVEQGPG